MVRTSPLPSAFGPFEVRRVLAEGGMSVVYLAAHRGTGEQVALKTVRVPDEVYLASLRREVHALSRLRHPGIVRIVAEGIADGMPWYAMELLAGETLADVHAAMWSRGGRGGDSSEEPTTVSFGGRSSARRALPDAGDVRPLAGAGQLPRALTLVRRICTPLAFLHGEGLVHCDLKPQNLFVRPGDLPVIMDFGLAWRAAGAVGREVAEVVTKVAGTPTYMAPEQIRLSAIDPRTDLYALGCVLYELVTGQPPFVGGHDVLVRHLTRVPSPPSSLVDGVPPELDALIMALLAKRPRDRLGHAADLAAALEKLGGAPEPFTSYVRPRAYVYRPELSGRDESLRELLDLVERPKAGAGACVMLGGESGIGKTYLATEVARRAATVLQVVPATCAPRGTLRGGGELQPFQELFGAIADRCTAMGAETTERLLSPHGKALTPFFPRLSRLPGFDELQGAPDLTGSAAREQVLAALRDAIAAFAHEQPLLLLFDDLQWADELTLALLRSLDEQWLSEHPVAILATYRSDEVEGALSELLARPFVRDVRIGRLDERTVRSVVRDMLAVDAPPDPFVRFLARASEGNPFFVAEYLRTAVADGLLRRTEAGQVGIAGGDGRDLPSGVFELLPMPRTLRDLVGRRLAALTAPARRIADVASVVGRDFDADVVQRAASVGEVEAMEGIAELLARQVAEVLPGGRLQFVHDKLREVAYDSLDSTARRKMHVDVAQAIEERALASSDPDALASALAHHWSIGRVEDKALEWTERAARRALSHAAYGEATTLFRRAIELADRRWLPPLRRARLDAGLANAALGAGDLVTTEEHFEKALARLGHPLPKTRTGWSALLLREIATQVLHLAGVRKRAPEERREPMREAAIASALITHKYFYGDDMLAMVGASLLSVNLAERAKDESAVPRAYMLVGLVAGALGREKLALDYFGRARAGAQAANDPVEITNSFMVESIDHGAHGRWALAEKAVNEAERNLAGVKDPFMRELVVTQLGHVAFYRGRFDQAREHYEELLRSARARGNEQHVTWALFSIARSLVAVGRHEEALPLLRDASAALSRKPELQSEIICNGLLAHAFARTGRLDEARAAIEATRSCIARARPTAFAALEGYGGALEALLVLAEAGDARALDEARALVKLLHRFARTFAMARSAAHRFEGEVLARTGAERRARRAFQRALAEALRCGMPREETAARAALEGGVRTVRRAVQGEQSRGVSQ